MTKLHRMLGPTARRPRAGRWAMLSVALFCLGFAIQIPSATSAASTSVSSPRQEDTPVPSPTPTCEQRCNARAHEVYEACIAMGRGPDACEKEANTAREICMRECPRPTATPSCEAKCGQRAENVFKECLAAGRGEDACHKEASDAKAACLRECPRQDVTATPKPTELNCEQRCAKRAEEVYKACIAAGRGPDVCEGEAKTAREACLRECPKPEPTRVPSCEAKCKARFDEVYNACIAAGRGPDACEAEAKTAREACMRECPRDATATPKPTEPTCEQRCARHAEEIYKACIAAGRGPDVCEGEAKTAREACVRECPKPEPTRVPGCEEKCKARFEEVYKACIAAGRGPDACENEARAAKEACLKECPRPDATKTPKAEEPTCEQRCKARFEEVYKACIAAGRGEDVCHREASSAQEACLKECPRRDATKTPQPISCEGRCKERAAAEFKACMDEGGDEKTCHERSNKVLQDCMSGCPKPTPKPEGCRDRCNAKADAVYKACRERGAGEEDCLAERTKAFNACMAACERPTETCESGCKQRAEAVFKACRDEGGDEAVCRERMRSALELCLKSCPKPQPVDCQDRCAQAAREVLAKCIAGGGGQEDCEARAKESYAQCLQHCDRPVPPAPIPDCSTKCARAGAAVFQRCLADGGTVESCTERMAQEIQRCLTECLRPGAVPTAKPPDEPKQRPIVVLP